MDKSDQTRPLAHISDIRRHVSDEEEPAAESENNRLPGNHKCIKCCGCFSAGFLLLAAVLLILSFTVFHVKDPIIRVNGISVGRQLASSSNVSMVALVTVKNPNAASFRYGNTTTEVYYRGVSVGEVHGPPGSVGARRTVSMNVTVDISTGRVMESPDFGADFGSGVLNLETWSRIPGRMKVAGIVKRHVTVQLNCSVSVDVTNWSFRGEKCRQKFGF
ncbi:hypothetical protein LINGRAHAP2_LOCUS290 [Linum grandiflorum]